MKDETKSKLWQVCQAVNEKRFPIFSGTDGKIFYYNKIKPRNCLIYLPLQSKK